MDTDIYLSVPILLELNWGQLAKNRHYAHSPEGMAFNLLLRAFTACLDAQVPANYFYFEEVVSESD